MIALLLLSCLILIKCNIFLTFFFSKIEDLSFFFYYFMHPSMYSMHAVIISEKYEYATNDDPNYGIGT
jgi:hypothetical protein